MTVGRTFDVKDAGKYLGVHPETLRRAWRRGEIHGTRDLLQPGGPLRFTKDALDSFKQARQVTESKPAG